MEIEEFQAKLTELFSTPNGKEVLDVFTDVYVNGPLFEPGDSEETAYRLGKRDLILGIVQDIERGKQ